MLCVTAQDDFQQVFPGMVGQGFAAPVSDDQPIGLAILAQNAVLLVKGFLAQEVAHQIKEGAIQDVKVHFDGFVTEGLGPMGFAHAGRPDAQPSGVPLTLAISPVGIKPESTLV